MKFSRLRTGLFLTLSLCAASSCGGGGGGGGGGPVTPADPAFSTLDASIRFGAPADGATQIPIVATIRDAAGDPIRNATVILSADGLGTNLVQPSRTDSNGVATGQLTSTVGEVKNVTALVNPGPDEVTLGPVQATFLRIRDNEYWVRESGSDGNSGRSPLEAWRSLGFALTQVGPGDTLYVGGGTYAETLSITTVASAGAPLTIHGDPEGCYTGDASPVLIEAIGQPFGVQLDGAVFVKLRGLNVTGAASGVSVVNGADYCAVVDCELFENDRGLDVVAASRFLVEGSRISGNFGDGVVFGNTSNSSLVHNLVYNNTGAGFRLSGTSTGLIAESNTLYRNTGDQLTEDTAGSTGMLRNNVLSEGGADGLALASGTNLAADSNLSWANAGTDFVGAGPSPGFSADPRLTDPFGTDGILGGVGALDDNFRFDAGSAAFDSGDRAAQDLTLAFGGPMTGFSSRGDGVADGTNPDGATLNLGFHYRVPADPFASLSPLGARTSFLTPGEVFLGTRGWDRSTDTWTPAANAVSSNSEAKWVEHRVSPLFHPDELVAVLSDTGSGTQLFVHSWDGRKWSDFFTTFVPSNIQSANSDQRGFDLEYEMVSGDALLVRSNDDNNPLFRVFRDGAWSDDAVVFNVPPGLGTILWVELEPRYGTDEVGMVALTDQANLVAAIWDGDQWTNELLVDTRVNELRDFQAFDLAWESLSGDMLVAWGYTNLIEETRYAEYDAQSGNWLTGQHFSTDSVGALTVLESDPTSNMVVAGYGEGNFDDDITIAMWDGDSWGDNVEIAPQGNPGSRAIDVGFIGESGLGYAIYRSVGQAGDLRFAFWDPQGWKNQTPPDFANAGNIVQVETQSIPGEDRILSVMLDENGSLFAITYDRTNGWTALNGGQPLATGLDETLPTRAFSLDFRRQ